MEAVEKVASAILYEGYHLWPDQRSAIKKQKRLTMSGVYPRIFSETARNGIRGRCKPSAWYAGKTRRLL